MGEFRVIVLDTHVLVWWVTGDSQLSVRARKAIAAEQRRSGQILVSAITAWEIAMLIRKGRLQLTMELDDWLAAVEGLKAVRLVDVSAGLAVQSVRLPGEFHSDPADRMIVALAREAGAPLLTADDKIRSYPHVRSIW